MGSSQSVTGRDGLAPGTINSATPYDSDADYEDAHEEIVTLSPSTSAGAARAGDEPVGATSGAQRGARKVYRRNNESHQREEKEDHQGRERCSSQHSTGRRRHSTTRRWGMASWDGQR